MLEQAHMPPQAMRDAMVEQLVREATHLPPLREDGSWVRSEKTAGWIGFLTSRATGIPVMLLLMGLIFWITIQGANVPSALLADRLFWIEDQLALWFASMHAPTWLTGMLVHGMTARWRG